MEDTILRLINKLFISKNKKFFRKLHDLHSVYLKYFKTQRCKDNNYLISNFSKIFPIINNRSINDYELIERINVSIDLHAKNDCKIIELKHFLPSLQNQSSISHSVLDQLLTEILNHVTINGKKINLDDCLVIDVLTNFKPYFPSIHSDIEWNYYIGDGFNVWYLLENTCPKNMGNMFYLLTDFNSKGKTLRFTPTGTYLLDNKVTMVNQLKDQKIDHVFNEIQYLDMRPGQCFIFNQQLMHSSDFRQTIGKRKSLNFRVLIKNENFKISENFDFYRLFVMEPKLDSLGGVLNRYSLY